MSRENQVSGAEWSVTKEIATDMAREIVLRIAELGIFLDENESILNAALRDQYITAIEGSVTGLRELLDAITRGHSDGPSEVAS